MRVGIILTAGFIFLISCHKENVIVKKSATELLTQKEWLIKSAGFDENENNIVDPNEDNLVECLRGNGYVFNTTGTGTVLDKAVVCDPTDTTFFTWQLTDSDLTIRIEFVEYVILRLNENELLLKVNLPAPDDGFLLRFSH